MYFFSFLTLICAAYYLSRFLEQLGPIDDKAQSHFLYVKPPYGHEKSQKKEEGN
jgi:hypothetical protein